MPSPVAPDFRIRFPVTDVPDWASQYEDDADSEAIAAGRAAAARGWYSRDEFLTVTDWQTDHGHKLRLANTEPVVRAATSRALTTADERVRIGALSALRGMGMLTSSTLLHFAHRDGYPIIDARALWSLGIAQPPRSCSFAYWFTFTVACRGLASAAGVDMRTLDRALQLYAAVHQ